MVALGRTSMELLPIVGGPRLLHHCCRDAYSKVVGHDVAISHLPGRFDLLARTPVVPVASVAAHDAAVALHCAAAALHWPT